MSFLASNADRAATDGRFAVINPGAGWPSKVWPPDRFAAVAWLGSRHAMRSLVVWAGDQERAWAEQIVAGSAGFGVLAPPTTLCQLAAVTRQAALFVGSDTGPLHIAVAVGTPCVGMFGPMPAGRNGPYGPQHIAVQKCASPAPAASAAPPAPSRWRPSRSTTCCAACEQILSRSPAGPPHGLEGHSTYPKSRMSPFSMACLWLLFAVQIRIHRRVVVHLELE